MCLARNAWSFLSSLPGMPGRADLVHWKVVCPRQVRRAKQAWEHGHSTDTGRDALSLPHRRKKPRRVQEGTLPRLCLLWRAPRNSQETPNFHCGEVNTSFRTMCYRPLWPTNLHVFQGRLSLPLDSHAWYTGKGTVAGCGLHSSRVFVDFQLLCSLFSSSAEKRDLQGLGHSPGLRTTGWLCHQFWMGISLMCPLLYLIRPL